MLPRTATVRDLDRLTARVFNSATRNSGCRLETYREGDTFHLDIDLPGIDPAGIDVTVDRTVLTIQARRTLADGEAPHSADAERPAGTLTRQVLLSDSLDTDRLEAGYDNGVLTLRIPVIEKAGRRKAEIELPAAA
jgi:HSP20 family protein